MREKQITQSSHVHPSRDKMKSMITTATIVFLLISGLWSALTVQADDEAVLPRNFRQETPKASRGDVVSSNGTYMGHNWYIDENHMIWWDDKPHIRYGFTGSPRIDDIDEFIGMGFNQFSIGPGEGEYVFSDNTEDHIRSRDGIDNYTTILTGKGCTYFAGLNLLLPWKNSGKIADEDRVIFLYRKLFDVTEYSDQSAQIELLMQFEESYEGYTLKNESTAYLFDFSAGQMTDISEKIDNITWEERAGGETDDEARRFDLVVSFSTIDFPDSFHLVIVVSVPIQHETVFAWDFPALWKDNIRDYYNNSLNFFKDAYRKDGLRGMLFGDEIGISNKTLFMWMYEDFNDDTTAMNYFHQWLEGQFESVENLNQYLGTSYGAIEDVSWNITPLPYESVAHLEEVEEPTLFGLYDSVEQVGRLNSLQNDFIFWFYGHWYAEYAKTAKETIGDVPVFTTVWASQNVNPLRIHYEAMLEGVDGLIRNSYGQVVSDAEGRKGIGFQSEEDTQLQDLEAIENMIDSAEREGGYTKAYLANEFYWVQAIGDEPIEGGVHFKFPTNSDLKEFLKVMIDHGYRGFHMFIMDPSDVYRSEDSLQREDMLWLSELKPEILGYMLGKGTIEGEVKTTSGSGISNATILITYSSNGTVLTEAKTDTDGLFSTPYDSIGSYNVPEGTYDITASKTGYETSERNNQTVIRGEITHISLVVQPKKVERENLFGELWFWVLIIAISLAIASLIIFIRKRVKHDGDK